MSTQLLRMLLLLLATIAAQGFDDWNYTADYEEEVLPPPQHYKLERYLMNNYNKKLIPKRHLNESVHVKFSIELYQIIEVNEPQQYILMNAWIVERWRDDMLYWNPAHFGGIHEIILPKDSIWIPDTTLYNSLVMDDAESRRLLNAKLSTDTNRKTVLVELLYPTLYKFSCMLDLRFFPFDVQACKMTFGSWTYDKNSIDYHPHNDSGKGGAIGTSQCIENEGWNILGTKVFRREVKYDCCTNKYTLLEFYLHIQRKPLFYLINLIAPTSVITLIAIVGFFSSSTINDMREEKISLGITTLLSMSILIFMVSDQMPSTSSFIPLIGWFYTCMMMLISGGTLCASMVIYAQKKGILGHRPTSRTMRWARWLGKICMMEMPLVMKEAYALKAKDKVLRQQKGQRKQSIWQRWQKIGRDISRLSIPSMHTQSTIMTADNSFTSISLKRVAAEPPPDLATLASISGEDLDDCSYQQISDDEKSSCVENGWKHPHVIHQKASLNRPRKNVGLVRKGSSYEKDCRGCNNNLVSTMMSRQRNLAELEYDWLAAVIERCFLIIFCLLFFFFSFGINGIGMYYWWNATVEENHTN